MIDNQINFDDFANTYTKLVNASGKGLLGGKAEYFSEYKIDILKRILSNKNYRILDFGCGIGNSFSFFNKYFKDSEIVGTDVSEESLILARKKYHNKFYVFDDDFVRSNNEKFDVIFISCVFHHIDRKEHASTLESLYQMLVSDGVIIMFEHNKLNPITLRSVNNCEFDKGAILFESAYAKRIFNEAGFLKIRLNYCTFSPPFLSFLKPIERFLNWCILGGQYYVVAEKRCGYFK